MSPEAAIREVLPRPQAAVSVLSAVLVLVGAAAAGLAFGLGLNTVFTAAVVVAFAAVLLSLREPQLAAVAAVALGMGRVSDVATHVHGAPSIYKPLVAFLAFLVLLRLLRTRGRSLVVGRTLGLLLALFVALAISAIFAAYPDEAISRLQDLGVDLLILALIANLLSDRRGLRWSLWAVVGLGAALATLTVYQGLSGNFDRDFFGFAQAPSLHIIGELNRPRASGPFGDPNFYAQYLLIFAALALFRAWDERQPILRWGALGALGLMLVALLFTFSRGAVVALGLTAVVVFLLRRPSLKIFIVGAALCLPLLFVMPQTFVERASTLVDLLPGQGNDPSSEISYRGRLSEFLAGLHMFADHPVLGVGPANYSLLYQEYASDLGLEYRRTERAAHNMFVELGAEAGFVGLSLFLLALASVVADLRGAARLFRRAGDHLAAGMADSLLVAIVAFLAAGLFLGLGYPRGLWLLFGLAIAARAIAQRAPQSIGRGPSGPGGAVLARPAPGAITPPAQISTPRVLHLIDSFDVGGAESLLPILGRSLPAAGVVPVFSALFECPRSRVREQLASLGLRPRVLGAHGMGLQTLRALDRHFEAEQPDLVHAHLTYASILGVVAARRRGIPIVVTLHQLGAIDWRKPRQAAREALFRWVVRTRADQVISVSAAVAEYYANRGVPRHKLRVVHNAIDPAPFQERLDHEQRASLCAELGLRPGARVLTTVAMLRKGKGIGVLLSALSRLVRRDPAVVLLIVGDGDERPRLEALTERLGLSRHVRFLGVRADVAALLQLSKLFVLPTRFEALPTVLLEANAAGVPSVASDVGGVSELVRHAQEGLLTPVGDASALANAICTLLEDRSLRQRLSRNARSRAQQFTPETWAEQLAAVYRDVLTSHAPASRSITWSHPSGRPSSG